MTDDNTTEREARYDRYKGRDTMEYTDAEREQMGYDQPMGEFLHDKNMTTNRIPEMPNPARYEYPEKDINGREGVFCGDCNTVMYAIEPVVTTIRYQPCPICGGRMFWITRDWQP